MELPKYHDERLTMAISSEKNCVKGENSVFAAKNETKIWSHRFREVLIQNNASKYSRYIHKGLSKTSRALKFGLWL